MILDYYFVCFKVKDQEIILFGRDVERHYSGIYDQIQAISKGWA